MGHLSRIAAVLQLLMYDLKKMTTLAKLCKPANGRQEILHCSVRRLYKSLKFTHGRGKYTKKPITASTVTEVSKVYALKAAAVSVSKEAGVDYLLGYFAFSDEAIVDTRITMHGQTIREIKCPCFKCQNLSFRDREIVQKHLYMNGFMLRDTTWHEHEENVIHEVGQTYTIMEVDNEDDHDDDGYEHMELVKENESEKAEKEKENGVTIEELVKEKESEKAKKEKEKAEKEAMLERMASIESLLRVVTKTSRH
ncbi:hypothetical protein E3N88_07672 [Mikania micrantha]|uniref:Transposase-associated domain-containing protein n=1 Tax=Mikania micrantha TaxID=192012 RepID=A0A5N6PF44_9ASTR|nr:hypothetical protein E3N88_07672 [Mikania micrantha]